MMALPNAPCGGKDGRPVSPPRLVKSPGRERARGGGGAGALLADAHAIHEALGARLKGRRTTLSLAPCVRACISYVRKRDVPQ